jgi:hypothetical protein
MTDEKREYVRSSQTGDRGYIVMRDLGDGNAVKCVRLDRGPHSEQLERYNDQVWVPDVDKRPLARAAVGKMLWDLDHAFCAAIGIRTEKDWLLVPEEERVKWMHGSPLKSLEPSARRKLYETNFRYLSEFVK